jgi:hypothetical protein
MSTILRAILRQGASLLVCLPLLYIGLLVLSLLATSRPNHEEERGLDTSLASNSVLPVHGNSIFLTEPQYLYLNRAPLRSAAEKVVLLGASNLELGFDLTELRALLPANVTVHKLALPGANMTEEREVIDLVQEVQSKEARQHETLVLGIWHGMFGEDRLVWYTPDRSVPGDTELDTEQYRYGFARRTANGPVPIVPWQYLDAAVTAIYPVLLLHKLSHNAVEWLQDKYYHPQPTDLNAVVMTEDERRESMNYWRKLLGPPGPLMFDEQFAVLEQVCDQILAAGSKLILVSLPLPKWHKKLSPYENYYEPRMAQELKRWSGRAGFVYLDMSDLDSDTDFYDEVHPRPRAARSWATRLATALSRSSSPGAAVAGAISEGSAPGRRIP